MHVAYRVVEGVFQNNLRINRGSCPGTGPSVLSGKMEKLKTRPRLVISPSFLTLCSGVYSPQ
jgi:hypothetical protein